MADENATQLAERIAELWSAERCDWKLEYRPRLWNNHAYWVVHLEWTQEYGNQHSADWSTHYWEVCGDEGESVESVLREAVRWLDDLAPWKQED